jgi:2-C-methyl-D-erythritol 4-phosphate cytidylyltransferase/2-C-methyl-D-erythritol 2,4-cyclodiphosphate synthase
VSREPFVSVIIAAAGRGTRAGGPLPKQWLKLGGRSVLAHTVDAFDRHPLVSELVIVLPPAALHDETLEKPVTRRPAKFVAGGERRQHSVANGFAEVSAAADVVLVHDAARPFTSEAIIDRTIRAAWESGAAIAAVPVHDTVKRAESRDGVPFVSGTLARDTIWLAQTPQGFRRDVLSAALAGGVRAEATDEAMLVEQAGGAVRIVEGEQENAKLTTAADVARVQQRMGESAAPAVVPTLRIGIGYDSHRFGAARPLKLGGVEVSHESGLSGHSDADAICHALTDALLGAANLGDIGGLFPDTDARWKDADSVRLLQGAWARVRAAGWALVNADLVVIAQQPKIGPHALAIRQSLASALDVPVDAISVKGKTPEGTDAMAGALVVHAAALLASSGRRRT